MDFEWSDVGSHLKKYGGGTVDVIGSILAGNNGQAISKVVKMVSGELGVEETPTAVMSALEKDPDSMVKVKELESRNKSELIELQIAKEDGWTERYKAQCAADGQSTRPTVVLVMTWMLAIPYVLIGIALARVMWSNPGIIKDLWMVLSAYLGIPLVVIKAYFGILQNEHAQRNGLEAKSVSGALFNIIGKK